MATSVEVVILSEVISIHAIPDMEVLLIPRRIDMLEILVMLLPMRKVGLNFDLTTIWSKSTILLADQL